MVVFFYNVVVSIIGLLCCLHSQANGNLSPSLYELDNSENNLFDNSVDSDFIPVLLSSDSDHNNNIQSWNKVSGNFNYKLKMLEHLMSGINQWSFDKILYQNVSPIPTKQVILSPNLTYDDRKLEQNISKRVLRQADNTDSQLKANLDTPSNVLTKTIENQSHSNFSSASNSTSTIINSTDRLLDSSTIISTFITSTVVPLISSTAENDNQTIQYNETSNDKIMLLSDILLGEQNDRDNYFFMAVIFLGIAIILVTGLFIVYKKYQDRSRRACYDVGYMCGNNVHEETPV